MYEQKISKDNSNSLQFGSIFCSFFHHFYWLWWHCSSLDGVKNQEHSDTTVSSIYGPVGLQAFQESQKHFNLPGTSLFLLISNYTQRCAFIQSNLLTCKCINTFYLNTYGIIWTVPLTTHPVAKPMVYF